MYKIVNNLAPTYLCNNIHERSDVHLYNTRRKNDLNPPLRRTTTAQRSFYYETRVTVRTVSLFIIVHVYIWIGASRIRFTA